MKMPDIQGEIEAKEEQAIKEALRTGGKLLCVIYESMPKFPQDIPELCPKGKSKSGKQSMKSLIGSGSTIENVEINGSNVGDFKSIARKFGVDYSLKKITVPQADGDDKIQYAVYFKSKNASVMHTAIQEYAKRAASRKRNPALTEKLQRNNEISKAQKRERSRERTKTRGQER
jgi:hypothetical protein